MSIAMEKFASEGHFASYNPFSRETARIAVFQLQCRSCGFEPDAFVTARVSARSAVANPGNVLRGLGAFLRMHSDHKFRG